MEEIFHPSSKFTLSYYSSCKLKLGETSGGGGSTISCEGATPDLHLNVKLYRTESGGGFHVYNAVNDELIVQTFGYYLNENADFASQLDVNPDYADKIEFLDLLPTVYDGDFVANAYIRIRDISSENIRIRVDVKNYGANDYEKTTLGILISYPNTPAIEWNENDATNAEYSLNACLAPQLPEYLNSFSLGIWAYNGMQGCTPIAGSTQCNGLSFQANVTINGNYYPNVTFGINGGISNSTIDNLVYCYGDSVGDLHVTAKDGVGVLNINLQRINADGNYLSTWSDNVIQSSDGLLVTIKGNDG